MNRDKIHICFVRERVCLCACVSEWVSVCERVMQKCINSYRSRVIICEIWMAMAMGQFSIKQLNAQTHTRTHTCSTKFNGWRWCFPLLATHCVCIQQNNRNYWRFFELASQLPAASSQQHICTNHSASFSVSKNRHNILECRKSETL